jgi:hypothetical protein
MTKRTTTKTGAKRAAETTTITKPVAFDRDDVEHCLSVVIGLCELAAHAVAQAKGEAVMPLDAELFDSAACLLMKARAAIRGDDAHESV